MESFRRVAARACASAVALALTVGVVACGGDDDKSSNTTTQQAQVQRGGSLKIGMTDDPGLDVRAPTYMQQHHWAFLNRTLYTYPLTPDGNTPVPDLASGPPEVSEDGLTWTVRIKKGLRYAPPHQDREIVTADITNSLNHLADPKIADVNAGNYTAIEGIDPNTGKLEGKSKTVSGVTTPDDYTIVIKLREPRGDFLHTLARPEISPAPPGAYDGHAKDYGRFIISSGPYMVDGSATLDPDNPKPLSGYVPGRSLTLVRNPSWNRTTDNVRQANPDRIEFSFGDTDTSIAQKVTNGELDLMFVTQAPPDIMRQYQTDPNLKGRLHINPKVSVRLATINVAQPPFDDVHVRRALNFVVFREEIRRADGGEATGELAYHQFPPNQMGGQLEDYDEYASSSAEEAVQKAMEEMKQSKYDPGKTGKCTDPVCRQIRLVPANSEKPETNIIVQAARKIGLNFKVETYSNDTAFAKCNDPKEKVAVCSALQFAAGAPDAWGASTDITTAFIGPNACCNIGLIGVPADELRKLGYSTTGTKSFDDQVPKCATTPLGDGRNECFAAIDREASDLALRLPLLFPNQREIISARVTNYTYDFYGYASLNRIALKAGGGAGS